VGIIELEIAPKGNLDDCPYAGQPTRETVGLAFTDLISTHGACVEPTLGPKTRLRRNQSRKTVAVCGRRAASPDLIGKRYINLPVKESKGVVNH
jgi:hypothetical protein